MMERTHVYITIIVYANTKNEHISVNISSSSSTKHFYVFLGSPHYNPRHIIYVNRFLLHDIHNNVTSKLQLNYDDCTSESGQGNNTQKINKLSADPPNTKNHSPKIALGDDEIRRSASFSTFPTLSGT
jgi:hypothetical protein